MKFYFDQKTRRIGKIWQPSQSSQSSQSSQNIQSSQSSDLKVLKDKKTCQTVSKLKVAEEPVSEAAVALPVDTFENNDSDADNDTDTDKQNDPDFPDPQISQAKKCIIDYEPVGEISERFDASIRLTEFMINKVVTCLSNAGALKDDIPVESLMISRFGVAKMVERVGSKALEVHKEMKGLLCIKFDGKKVKSAIGHNKFSEKFQDFVTVISEPGGQYVDHIIPRDGGAEALASELFDLLKQYQSCDTVYCIGSDGTAVNTGHENGTIKRLEVLLNHPVNWCICLIHFVELIFKHLFKLHDGDTTSAGTYKGVIGQEISRYKSKFPDPILRWKAIPGKVPLINQELLNNLSSEQQLFYHFCIAIQSGNLSANLASKDMPKLHEARWVTKCLRCLRLYVTKLNPSRSLLRLCQIVLNVYGPIFFKMKSNWDIRFGADNYFYALVLCRDFLQGKEIEIYQKEFRINCYFANPEAVLLTGMFDKNLNIRKEALKWIMIDRRRRASGAPLRQFVLPGIHINFQAERYMDLVDLDSFPQVTEPPLLFKYSNEALINLANGAESSKITFSWFPEIPSHSQNNERKVQDTSIAVKKYTTKNRRNSNMLVTNENREKLPKDASKSSFLRHQK